MCLFGCGIASAQTDGPCGTGPDAAAEQATGYALSFGDALQLMEWNNPRIKASGYELSAAVHERKAAFGLRLPTVGITGGYVHMAKDIKIDLNSVRDRGKNLFDGFTGWMESNGIPVLPEIIEGGNMLFGADWSRSIVDRNMAMIGGTVTMPLFAGGKINAANRAAKIKESTAEAKDEQVRSELVSELVERYYGVMLADRVVAIRRQVVEAVDHHLRDAVALEENGMIARSERLFVEVKKSEAERDLIAARLQAEVTRSALANTLNDHDKYSPVSTMFVLESLPPRDRFVDLALENSPILGQVGLMRDMAVEGANVQKAEFFPEVAVMGGINIYDYHVSNIFPRWVVGGTVSIKLFDGLNREHKYQAARQTVKQAESMQEKAANDIAVFVEQLYNQLKNYEERMPAIEKSIEFRTEYLRVTNAGFREGVTSASDVMDAELELASTLIEKLQTAYQYDVALAKLLEASGLSDRFASYAAGEGTQAVSIE